MIYSIGHVQMHPASWYASVRCYCKCITYHEFQRLFRSSGSFFFMLKNRRMTSAEGSCNSSFGCYVVTPLIRSLMARKNWTRRGLFESIRLSLAAHLSSDIHAQVDFKLKSKKQHNLQNSCALASWTTRYRNCLCKGSASWYFLWTPAMCLILTWGHHSVVKWSLYHCAYATYA